MEIISAIAGGIAIMRFLNDCGRWLLRRRLPAVERRSGVDRRQTVISFPPSAERRSGLDRRAAPIAA